MLELSDVHVQYGNIRSLQGVSLRVAEGELVALIGSSGAIYPLNSHPCEGASLESLGRVLGVAA